MTRPLPTAKNISSLTPDELDERLKDPKATGNKEAFLRAAFGTMTEEEGAHFLKLIDDVCERIDE